MLRHLWSEDEGFLTFEWILLLTLLIVGVIGGIAAIRDAVLHETQGIVGAMVSLDQSYDVVPPLGVGVDSLIPVGSNCSSTASFSRFNDSAVYAVGRFTPEQLVNIAQPVVVANGAAGLCGIP